MDYLVYADIVWSTMNTCRIRLNLTSDLINNEYLQDWIESNIRFNLMLDEVS